MFAINESFMKKLNLKQVNLFLCIFVLLSVSFTASRTSLKVSAKMLQLKTLNQLGSLSTTISDPNRAFMVMKNSMKSRIKLQNKTAAKNFLRKCLKKGVGTNEIESLARKNLYGSNVRFDINRNKAIEKEVKRLLKMRIMLVEKELLKLKFEWIKQKNAMLGILKEMTANMDMKHIINMFTKWNRRR